MATPSRLAIIRRLRQWPPLTRAYDAWVADYWLVETARGPGWVPGRSRREQSGWDAHAAFMDRLVEDGLVVLGGPVGDLDGDEAFLVLDAPDEDEVRRRLADDPWVNGVLSIRSVRPWTIWLRGENRL